MKPSHKFALTLTVALFALPWVFPAFGQLEMPSCRYGQDCTINNLTLLGTSNIATVELDGGVIAADNFVATTAGGVGVTLEPGVIAGAASGSAGITCLVTAAVNDSFTLRATTASDSQEVTPIHVNLNVARLN